MYKILANLLLRRILKYSEKRKKEILEIVIFFHKIFYVLKMNDKITILNIIHEYNIFGK